MTRAARASDPLKQPLARMRAFVDSKSAGEASFTDVVALAEISAQSMQALFASIDAKIYAELREISEYVTTVRAEIAALRVGELNSARLPEAGAHLGAIKVATEDATNAIMEAAEAMLAAEGQDEAAYKALVTEKVMAIFEACSFQDITGQRVSRVVQTLEQIEKRMARFADAMKAIDACAEPEDASARRARELLLHGPSLKGTAIGQSDVDALMAEPAER